MLLSGDIHTQNNAVHKWSVTDEQQAIKLSNEPANCFDSMWSAAATSRRHLQSCERYWRPRIGHLRGPVRPSSRRASAIHLICTVSCLLTRRVDRAAAGRGMRTDAGRASDVARARVNDGCTSEKFVNSGNDRLPCDVYHPRASPIMLPRG